MLVATDYLILRNKPSTGLKNIPLPRKPLRIVTLLHEEKFLSSGGVMKHLGTVFFEDEHHDWSWRDGQLRYYSRCGSKDDALDILVVYGEEERTFCILCGGPQPHHKTNCPVEGIA